MKAVLLFASVLMATPAAFASVDFNNFNNNDDQAMDVEVGSMPQDEADALSIPVHMNRREDRGAEIAGDVFEIIGAIAADRIDEGGRSRRRGPPGGGPGHGGSGYPGDDGGWGRPDREFVCFARDRRGRVYRAIGRNPRRVQDRAMENCERNARFCRPQGCRRI